MDILFIMYKLKHFIDKINPNIFELDYEALKNRISIFKEELIAKALHPKRIEQWLENGIDIEDL